MNLYPAVFSFVEEVLDGMECDDALVVIRARCGLVADSFGGPF